MYGYRDGLASERLTTRFLEPSDAKAWSVFFDDGESTRYLPKFDFRTNGELASFWIERQMDRYRENRYGLQALTEKATGKFIGLCGLLAQEVDAKNEIEIGYHVLKEFRGRGFAPEAAKLFMDYAFGELGAVSLISIIAAENAKSRRVAEKNGFAAEKRTLWNGMDVIIFRKTAK